LTPFNKDKVFLVKNSQIEKKYHLKLRRIVTIVHAAEIPVNKSFSTGHDVGKKLIKPGGTLIPPKLVMGLVWCH